MFPVQIVNDMPIPENLYTFFGSASAIKFVNITDSVSEQLHGVYKNNPGVLQSINKDTNEITFTTVIDATNAITESA